MFFSVMGLDTKRMNIQIPNASASMTTKWKKIQTKSISKRAMQCLLQVTKRERNLI